MTVSFVAITNGKMTTTTENRLECFEENAWIRYEVPLETRLLKQMKLYLIKIVFFVYLKFYN